MDGEVAGKALGMQARIKSVRTRLQEELEKITRMQEKLCTFPPKPLLASPSYLTSSKTLDGSTSMETLT